MVAGAARVGAGQLGSQIPSNCVAHISFDGGVDLVDDYRCAGLAIEFHTAGVAFSPGPIWAGQWLFVDEAGQFRVGSCTFNRGIHPTIDVPSSVVPQSFPNDPTGAKAAYLTWRYGDTTDNLTAAAMWAVLHYYAQDAAGTRRTSNGEAPLVPSLGMIARASGRTDIQQLAVSIDSEAARFAGEWAINATVDIAGNIEVTLTAAGQPVADAAITLLMSGQDSPTIVTTDAAGVARSTMPVAPGVMTVVATSPVPGPAVVYRGKPAGPDPHGAQNLVTGGAPGVVSATATVDVPMPTTTTSTPTTTMPRPRPTMPPPRRRIRPPRRRRRRRPRRPRHRQRPRRRSATTTPDHRTSTGPPPLPPSGSRGRAADTARGAATPACTAAPEDRKRFRRHLLPGHVAAGSRHRDRRRRQPPSAAEGHLHSMT